METKIYLFIAIKLLQAAFKNFKFYLAIALLFTIDKEQNNTSSNSGTITAIVYLSFFSLILSRFIAWIFLEDFSRKDLAAFKLLLHISGLIDFYYVIYDSTCLKPHNSLRFYISNISSMFCFPAYVIVVILNDSVYQGIDQYIIYTVILLSAINEGLVYSVYGLPTGCSINKSNVYFSFLQIFEFVTSMSFTGLVILNIRYSLPFLISYFSFLPVMFILLPCCSNVFYLKNKPIQDINKAFFLMTFWLNTYQSCINRVQNKKKIFADISDKTDQFFNIFKFMFYQFPYFFFVEYKDEIQGQVSNQNQIQVLFIIATICQLKLIYDIIYSLFIRNRTELVINSSELLQKLVHSGLQKQIERIIVKMPDISDENASQLLFLCLCKHKQCEVIINNSKNGRFKSNEDSTQSYSVKLDFSKFENYQSLKYVENMQEILNNIHYLEMKLYKNVNDKNVNQFQASLLSKIFNSSINYFHIEHDSKHNDDIYNLVEKHQGESVRAVLHYLVFQHKISPSLTVNPSYVLFDLYSN